MEKMEFGYVVSCDYHYLNKYTRGDAHPTPDITDVIHKVGKAQCIANWDMRRSHRWFTLTAFVTNFSVFEWIGDPALSTERGTAAPSLFGPCLLGQQLTAELLLRLWNDRKRCYKRKKG